MFKTLNWIPQLLETVTSSYEGKERVSAFLSNNQIVCCFRVPLIDLESKQSEERFFLLQSLFQSLPSDILFRINLNVNPSFLPPMGTYRSHAIQQIGLFNKEITLSFQRKFNRGFLRSSSSFSVKRSQSQRLWEALPLNILERLTAKMYSSEELTSLFDLPKDPVSISYFDGRGVIEEGRQETGILRIYKPSGGVFSISDVSQLISSLPSPFEISVSFKKTDALKAEFFLRSRSHQNEASNSDVIQTLKGEALSQALEETQIQGGSLFEMEWLLVLKRSDPNQLIADLKEAQVLLGSMGVSCIENRGMFPSFLASKIGSIQHQSFQELESSLALYCPVFFFGSSESSKPSVSDRTLLLHREDGSLETFDLFDPNYLCFNALIAGKSGSGKSVLGNLLTSSLLSSDEIELIKIDVGGSYQGECQSFSGQEMKFSLDRPSGLNPFKALRSNVPKNEVLSALSLFLASLVREEGEWTSKNLLAEIEECLLSFLDQLEKDLSIKASLDSFFESAQNFSRRDLLRRFTKGRAFGKLFECTQGDEENTFGKNRYLYFNFEGLSSASNADFSSAVMAAVMCEVNLRMLLISFDAKSFKGQRRRLVLFCDETKFFIDRHSDFFLLLTANFRKFGHSVILIAQDVQSFLIQKVGAEPDAGILLNSPIRFLFELGSEERTLASLNLNSREIELLSKSPYRGSDFRQAVLQDDLGSRVVRLRLSPKEYWATTSRKEDVLRLEGLRRSIPGLSLNQASFILSQLEELQLSTIKEGGLNA